MLGGVEAWSAGSLLTIPQAQGDTPAFQKYFYMLENMVCALSPISGIGLLSPLMAPIKPITHKINNATLIIQKRE